MTVTLRPITEENFQAVIELEVRPEQAAFVAPNVRGTGGNAHLSARRAAGSGGRPWKPPSAGSPASTTLTGYA